MTRCPNCSGENAETQRFCGECGTPLPVDLRRVVIVPEVDETIPLPAVDLPPGSLFARRYQVIDELGVGGMGRVYRVIDKKLDEEIALKVIRPEVASDRAVIARFSSELKLARQVVHKNVARMFDLNEEAGVPYITMEYVKGENLKSLIRKVDRLSPGQALPIACQICDGLAEAHRLGIVHRDLKPQNVMIDEDGRAKIMDFGLARLRAQEGREAWGSRSGSPAYVSPEQVQGAPPDARSDLYSLGILMYEMLTGRTPFKADSVKALIEMHLHEVAEEPRELNPAISEELSRIIMKCLEKDPGRRFQSAAELREALGCLTEGPEARRSSVIRRGLLVVGGVGALAAGAVVALMIARPAESWKRSVAVLPVEDTGTKAAHWSFLAGLQSEVTDRLSAIPDLRVLPVLSVNSHDAKGKSTPQIGKALGVRYLVKLTLAEEEGRVEAKIYLFDSKRDVNRPPMTYGKDLTSYRALQDEIARLTAKALGVDLAPERLNKISGRGTDNIEAYGLFLEGIKTLDEGNREEDFRRAIATLTRAIAIDPKYALGHWALGYAYENLYYSRVENKDMDALGKMYEHFNQASLLDPSFAETNLGLGWYYFNKGDTARAFESFRKALRLEPDGYIVNRDAGAFLRSIGLYKQAMPYLERAAKLSPLDPMPLTQIAQCWLFLGRFDKALTCTGKALAIRANDPYANGIRALLLVLTGRLDQAIRQIEAMEHPEGSVPSCPLLQEVAAALKEGRGKAHAFIAERPALTPQGTYIYLAFGMKDEALANIQAGIDRGFWNGTYYYSYPSLVKNPWYKDLRGDPRFEAMLKRQKELYDKELKAFEKL